MRACENCTANGEVVSCERCRDILKFISRFTDGGKRREVEVCFTEGCCYWFAHILHSRFDGSHIVYDERENHFGCLVDGQIYDIRGNVTNDYRWETWENFAAREPGRWEIIAQNCIHY